MRAPRAESRDRGVTRETIGFGYRFQGASSVRRLHRRREGVAVREVGGVLSGVESKAIQPEPPFMHTSREASHADPTKLAAARHAQGRCGARGGHASTFTVTGNSGGGVQGGFTRGRFQGEEAPKERLRVDKAMHVIPKSQEHVDVSMSTRIKQLEVATMDQEDRLRALVNRLDP